jgi:hypothetical protein
VQHLVPWVQDVLDQARERQVLLDTLRQQREAAPTVPAVPQPLAPQAPSAPTDSQALIQQAVQQALAVQAASTATPPATSPAPPSTTTAANGAAPVCPLHQVAMERRSNAHGSWWSHWLASEKRYCKGHA